MNQVQENTFEQKNNDYENFDWVHERDSILLNLLRQKKNVTPFKSEILVSGQDQLMNQQSGAYFDQQPSHDIQFKTEPLRSGQDPDLWVNAQDQSVIRQHSANLHEFTNMETETALNNASLHHGYWEAQGQSTIDQNYPANQVIEQGYQSQGQSNIDQNYPANQVIEQDYQSQGQSTIEQNYPVNQVIERSYQSNSQVTIDKNHQIHKVIDPTYQSQSQSTIGHNQSHQVIYQNNQPYQGIEATYPEPGPSVQNNATRKAEAEIIALGQVTRSTLANIDYTRMFHASNAEKMVSRPTQTIWRGPSGASKTTQTLPPTEDSANGLNCPRIKRLYYTLKKLDRKPSFRTTSENALRVSQARQMILQSVNLQMATLNKFEAQSIFRLYQQPPFPTRSPQRMRSTAYRAKPCTASEFFHFS